MKNNQQKFLKIIYFIADRVKKYYSTLISVSYDMSTMVWNTSESANPLMNRFDHHTEFAVGLDCNLFIEKQIATTSWDKKTSVFNFDENPQLVA